MWSQPFTVVIAFPLKDKKLVIQPFDKLALTMLTPEGKGQKRQKNKGDRA